MTPCLQDRYNEAGVVKGVYFLQDLWAAKYIYDNKIDKILDLGSRIDGFVAHVLPYCKVEYVDIRELNANINNFINNLTFIKADILKLPFDDSTIENITCLHVIEHIGLGRYGDNIDSEGYKKAAKEIVRVLAIGGKLILSTPIGVEQLYFNAHRVFSPYTIMEIFKGLRLIEFHLIDDSAEKIVFNATFDDAVKLKYGCGCFVFKKE